MLGVAAAAGAGLMLRRANQHARELKTAARMMAGLIPVVLVAALALAGAPVYFAGRSESQGWALVSVAVAILLAGLPVVVRWIAAGSYALVGLLTIVFWLGDLPSRAPAPGVEVGIELASAVEKEDRVVIAGLWQLEVRHGLAVGSSEGKVPPPVETIPRSQAGHPGWLDTKALASPDFLAEARALERDARLSGQRVWLIWSPSLPLERTFFPAFRGWRRASSGDSPIITVDVLILQKPAE
jgi:hypothetical protein